MSMHQGMILVIYLILQVALYVYPLCVHPFVQPLVIGLDLLMTFCISPSGDKLPMTI